MGDIQQQTELHTKEDRETNKKEDMRVLVWSVLDVNQPLCVNTCVCVCV